LEDRRPDVVKSKSLSLFFFTLRPPVNPDAEMEFSVLGDSIKVSDIIQAMWVSKDNGYASFIQPKYITDCTCESTAERAEGVVTFKHNLFAGRIPFVAKATKDGWIITEFRLPQYKTRVVRGKDGVWSQEALPGMQPEPEKKDPAKQKPAKEKDEETATDWGKEVDGLQLGLALVPADKIVYRPGEEIKFDGRVRNVSKEPITISYGRPESEPEITDARGEKVWAAMPPMFGIVIPTEKVLRPDESFLLFERKIVVEIIRQRKVDPEANVSIPTIRVPAGKYKIVFSEFVQTKLILSTGSVDIELKDKIDNEPPEKKVAFTAWGKEVGGLQAGLGFKPGEKRAYSTGEPVKFVVRVRNVGKEEVKFHYCRETYFENPRAVTDSKGKQISLELDRATGFAALVPVTLAPGKEIEVGERELELKPTLYRTGKYSVQFEQLETPENDMALSKLASGMLELEVTEPEQVPEKKEEVPSLWGKEFGGLPSWFSDFKVLAGSPGSLAERSAARKLW
jgi:hypothetical protein